ncbi:CLAVATA3/ESR-RELATED 16 [Hibiscus trionum]|uniref:CLAVATA3/ESR-RELATED 16 n=1 Tax=Hibiscus trionum TaxID=183268 RepID=A0A9W7MUD7_HIBTR|nr:CLAVATA3/ESR-RELATED 16 [Hibiscus trionum]
MTIPRVAVLLLWIVLVLSQLGLHFAVHEESSSSRQHSHRSFRSAPPRKVWVFGAANSFQAPSSSPKLSGNEDEKRIVHTGPNPLHN